MNGFFDFWLEWIRDDEMTSMTTSAKRSADALEEMRVNQELHNRWAENATWGQNYSSSHAPAEPGDPKDDFTVLAGSILPIAGTIAFIVITIKVFMYLMMH